MEILPLICSIYDPLSPFIDLFLDITPLVLFGKKDKLPCKNISYIFVDSNRPKNQSSNVCLSQLLSILYFASSPKFGFFYIHKLISPFQANGFEIKRFIGFEIKRLHKIILNFLQHNQFPSYLYTSPFLWSFAFAVVC